MITRRLMVLAVAGLLGPIGLAVPATAHEIGTTQVSITIEPGGRIQGDIVTDANALAEKLSVMAGEPVPEGETVSQLQTRLTRLEQTFRTRVALQIDDHVLQPSLGFAVAPADDPAGGSVATIHLTGTLPSAAQSVSWTYGWTFASYALRLRHATAGDEDGTVWLEGGETSTPFSLVTPAPSPGRVTIARRYLALGFTHIVPYGIDHVLFVIGIYLLSRRPRSILLQVSAFTVAHSITLGLSLYGVISATPRIVEPMIAVSIAYVAIENIFLAELRSWRVALVFAFGLLHGMGFAGALQELGLPRSEFLTALLTFNAGVEAGQLAVIATAFVLVGWPWADRVWYRSRVVVPASVAIACTAVYWTVERLSF